MIIKLDFVLLQNEMCAIYVHKLLNVLGRHEIETKDLLSRFSMQLLHRKIKFTACGLFALDNTLIFTVNEKLASRRPCRGF